MGLQIPVPSGWEWALFLPSLAALLGLLARGLAPEGSPLRGARWGAPDIVAVLLIHVFAQAAAGFLGDIPFLPEAWSTGGGLVLADALSGLAVLAIGRASGGSWAALGLGWPRRPRNLGATAAAYATFLVPLGILVWAWIRLLGAFGRTPMLQQALQLWIEVRHREDWIGAAALVLGAAVLAPVVEELLFRGFLFGVLRSQVGAPVAAVLASAIFAVFHVQLELLLPIFLVGIVLNTIYIRTGRLAYPILFHVLFNGGTLLLSGSR